MYTVERAEQIAKTENGEMLVIGIGCVNLSGHRVGRWTFTRKLTGKHIMTVQYHYIPGDIPVM